ncbi:alpha/beta hydrolase fold-domain-containing protein [Astrocystis sublimbata]|nr:alpha/beta hydrolase fold-domain-containing protein [Astrocystis sublimbata]
MGIENVEKDPAAELKRARRGIIWSLLPQIPTLVRLFLARVLGLSETARYIDLETDITLTILRSMLGTSKPQPVGKTQGMTLLDPGVKGRIWIAKAVAEAPPERGVREAVMSVIRSMSDSEAQAAAESLRAPDVVPVEAEWTGYRAGVASDEPLPEGPEGQKYEAMVKECKNATTVLYFHGGAYYLCDPVTHRALVKRMAKNFGGRVYSVRYRLAPQHPFPAALLDALVSYFTLLYPPPGSMHEAVSPRDIIFGGDSAGGNLALALSQLLLQLRRQDVAIPWFGADRAVPLPGGIAVLSPWLDIVQSLPSWTKNSKWDYLPPPSLHEKKPPPPDDIWPAKPPREHLFVDDAFRIHPLVCLHLAESWAGLPPVWVSCGWESLADEDKYIVSRLRADDVSVVFEEYEAMPHVFPAVVPKVAQTERCMQGLTRFITAVRKDPASITSSYTCIKAKTLEEVEGDVAKLTPFQQKDVFQLAYSRVGREAPLPLVSPKL